MTELIIAKGDPDVPNDCFTADEQNAFLELLSRGASPALACKQIGRPLAAFFHTAEQDDAFRQRLETVETSLAQNIATALYKAAMEGNVTAQTFWLRNNPPPGWNQGDSKVTNDDLEKLSLAELIALAEAHGVAVPLEVEPRTESPGGEPSSGGVSPHPATDE